MTVDLEAIARRSDSELSSLKLALPLIEQGFAPPFLARYRRDELAGVGEGALWMLMRSIRSEQALAVRREELNKVWQRTRLADTSLQKAIRDAKSKSAISRVARRLKNEPADEAANIAPEVWVASRILNPEPGDSGDIESLAGAVGQGEHADKITQGLDRALARRLAEHPQLQAAAVRWLMANASIRFLEVSDPNIEAKEEGEARAADAAASPAAERPQTEPGANWPSPEQLTATAAPPNPQTAEQQNSEQQNSEQQNSEQQSSEQQTGAQQSTEQQSTEQQSPGERAAADEPAQSEPQSSAERPPAGDEPPAVPDEASRQPTEQSATQESPGPEPASPESTGPESTGPESTSQGDASSAPASAGAAVAAGGETATAAMQPAQPGGKKQLGKKSKAKPIVKQTKVFKKLSPRQRRRRWLIGILQPLVGKTVSIKNLSPFQILILSRALRAHLVRCQFVYDANQLIAQLRKTAASLNPAFSDRLSSVVAEHEAAIRETTESVWWDELQDTAINRLVDLTAAHLDTQLHRGPVDAKTVLALDAVGPRTSPVSIVSSDGRLLHTEDIASQLDTDLRTASVTRLGELIHRFGVDLIVISNGPARRAAMVVLGELISQSPEGSIRWTIAERSGADAYAGSDLADREMRVTPRRFRAAAWLAFSLLKPAWSLSKVDPLKLRLSAAQRELPEELLAPALHDVMSSAVSRGGLDVNSAAVDSLAQLPGVTRKVAEAIDRSRRQSLFTSREQVLALEEWPDDMHRRQAIGFLRVFGGEEPLDATVIHPEDYALARKLAKALQLELPPSAPPGYQRPTFDDQQKAQAGQTQEAASGEAASDPTTSADDALGQTEEAPFAAELLGGTADAADHAKAAAHDNQQPESQSIGALGEGVGEATAGGESAAEPDRPESDQERAPEQEGAADSGAELVEAPVGGEDAAAQADAQVPADSSSDVAAPTGGRQKLPEPAAINKCIREWQVGSSRAHRLVHALCDPFGEEAVAHVGAAPAVLTRLPKAADLRGGDQVIGVVASVAAFGAFVEISPELTGLIRVSRLAEQFVEEIHDFIQVGDVVTAWVTEIDSRRRLQLSAVSPQREQELRRQRQEQREQRNQYRGGRGERGGRGQGASAHGGQGRSGQAGGPPRGGHEGAQRREGAAAQGGQGNRASGHAGSGGSRPGGHGGARAETRGGDSRRGGRDDSRRGEGRGRDRGQRRDEPTSYSTKVAKNQPPAAPITEAMAEGKEPLRSFGDLLQFFKKDIPAPPPNKGQQSKQEKPSGKSQTEPAQGAPAPSETAHHEPAQGGPVHHEPAQGGPVHHEPAQGGPSAGGADTGERPPQPHDPIKASAQETAPTGPDQPHSKGDAQPQPSAAADDMALRASAERDDH